MLQLCRLAGDKKYRKEKFKWPKLAASIAIDAVGVSSYAFPVVGESEDVVWAPISAALVQLIYGNCKCALTFYLFIIILILKTY